MRRAGDIEADRRNAISRRDFGALVPGLCLAALTLAGSRAATAGSGTASGAVEMLQPAELAAKLKAKDFVLVNVHIPYDGEIAGTDSFIPFDRIGENLALLPADKAAPVVVYCRSGGMSAIAGQRLLDLGYSRVADLAGGMNAWSDAGFELVRN